MHEIKTISYAEEFAKLGGVPRTSPPLLPLNDASRAARFPVDAGHGLEALSDKAEHSDACENTA